MKKFLSLLLIGVLSIATTFGQAAKVSTRFASETTKKDADTVVNATTKYQILKVANSSPIVTIQTTAKKLSGTTAGTVRIYGSVDKVAWVKLDSLVLANVAYEQTKFTIDQPSRYLWYRVSLQGSGTHSTQLISTIAASK